MRHQLQLMAALLLAAALVGCGGGGSTGPEADGGGKDAAPADRSTADSSGGPETVPGELVRPDLADGAGELPGLDGGEVGELDDQEVWQATPCNSHADCDDGLCVEVSPGSGQHVCAPFCLDECPGDWECKSVYVDGPDPVSLCFPPTETICAVCSSDSQCIFAGSLCIKGSAAVGFCGKYCHITESPICPDGFVCGAVTSKTGTFLGYQCQPPEGSCCIAGKKKSCNDDNPCTLDYCDPGVGCKHKNQDGPCDGPEPCADYKCVNGACIGMPITEDLILDGIDEDCDGETDEDWYLAARILVPLFSASSHTVKGGGLTVRGNLSGPPAAGYMEGGDFRITPVVTKMKLIQGQ